jgi:hypothetical protein
MSSFTRRLTLFLASAIAVITAVAMPAGATASAPSPTTPITQARAQQIGTDAYVYGISLMEFQRQQQTQTSVTVPNSLSDAPLNQLGNARNLADAAHAVFVQPNNDTLYTMGHIDLSHGPLVLHVPAVANHRYYSFEFLDPYTNVFHYVGTRTTGDGAGNYAIVGPKFHGKLPAGVHRITSSYQHMWLVGRTLVNGPSDLPAVHKVQNGYKLIPLKGFERVGLSWKPARPSKIVTTHRTATVPTGLDYFDALGTALAQNPPPARDAGILRELATVGIGPGRHPSSEHLSPAVLAGLQASAAGGPGKIAALRAGLSVSAAAKNDGWVVIPKDIGAFGTDYNTRGIVAVYGLAGNRPAEAMYPVGAFDNTGALLSGAHRYVVHFAAGQLPPARFFWSLTMYDQNFYLVPNKINRYEISNRTAGLKRNADGSLDVYVQSTPPAGHQSNWLPSPSSGPFEITMRLYGPKASALNGTYHYPPITRVG